MAGEQQNQDKPKADSGSNLVSVPNTDSELLQKLQKIAWVAVFVLLIIIISVTAASFVSTSDTKSKLDDLQKTTMASIAGIQATVSQIQQANASSGTDSSSKSAGGGGGGSHSKSHSKSGGGSPSESASKSGGGGGEGDAGRAENSGGDKITEIANTVYFKVADGQSTIQAKVEEIFGSQKNSEFGDKRHALLFAPGDYSEVKINVGYYTSVVGIGKKKSDVVLGALEVPKGESGTDLDNFWRSGENVTINNKDINYWRVSQAAPLDRIHCKSKMRFSGKDTDEYSSGGYMANSVVDQECHNWSQQQWISVNSQFNGGWVGGAWNFLAVGCEGNVPDCVNNDKVQPLWSKVAKTPRIAAKCFLYFCDTDGRYKIMKPRVVTDHQGLLPDDPDNANDGEIITNFYVAEAGENKDTAQTINAQLEKGRHLLLTPGIYKIDEPIKVRKNGTVVLGLGLATLQPVTGKAAMVVTGTGVRLASFMVQAGEPYGGKFSETLLQIGDPGSRKGTAADPTIVSNVFARVGGPSLKEQAKTMVTIHQDHVIGTNLWLWRADHDITGMGQGLGPMNAKCDHAIEINGHDVSFYGLFVEHTLKQLILWNGERGRLHFLQSELAYDVSKDWDFPCLEIHKDVKEFYGQSLAVYSFFAKKHSASPGPSVSCAIKCPVTENIRIQSACSLMLNAKDGHGSIEHVIMDHSGQQKRGIASNKDNWSHPQWAKLNVNSMCN